MQGADFDPETGTFTVPARTTAVFQIAQPDTGTDDNDDGSDADGDNETPRPDGGSSGSTNLLIWLMLLTLAGSRLYIRRR